MAGVAPHRYNDIENLHFDSDAWPAGLFSEVAGTVENLGVIDANIYSYCHVGVIVGILDQGGVLRNAYATGILASYSDDVGGLVGQNAGSIIDSYADVEVTEAGSYCVGGLVGVTDGPGLIRGSYARGPVVAFRADRVGGLVGCNHGILTDSYATGSVAGNSASANVGGLVGTNNGTVARSYDLDGDSYPDIVVADGCGLAHFSLYMNRGN